MSDPNKSSFVYVTYIRTTPQKLWDALTRPEFNRQFWYQAWQDCEWKAGASWRLMLADGRVADSGQVLEIDPPRRFVLAWRNEFRPELHEEGTARMTCVLEPQDDMVKLTITHEIDRPKSKFIEAVSSGWPIILASLKSLLETGQALEVTGRAKDK
jgi:uncharacterized protein YndB with AHSA1/START domain